MANLEELLEQDRTLVMGVVNVTPDSFSDGGRLASSTEAVEYAQKLAADGADILDIGGESSRPGAEPVSEDEELARVVPVVEGLRGSGVCLSIDTYKPAVARACLDAGAEIINDITALAETEMRDLAAERGAPVVLLHMPGTPETMQDHAAYFDVVKEVRLYLAKRAEEALFAGVRRVIVDPGLGFGKLAEHNWQLLRRLSHLSALGYPVLSGPSRKSFIGEVTGVEDPSHRVYGSMAAVALSVANGARIVRVHDVAAAKQTVAVADAIRLA